MVFTLCLSYCAMLLLFADTVVQWRGFAVVAADCNAGGEEKGEKKEGRRKNGLTLRHFQVGHLQERRCLCVCVCVCVCVCGRESESLGVESKMSRWTH